MKKNITFKNILAFHVEVKVSTMILSFSNTIEKAIFIAIRH